MAEHVSEDDELAAWMALNARQQGILAVIYELYEVAGQDGHQAAAREHSREPEERLRVDFAHDPARRDMFGMTEMQARLNRRGWDNQGNGSTIAALQARGLIARGSRPTAFGVMLTVALTPAGLAAARAGTAGPATAKTLGHRSWEVLARLWQADIRGGHLKWAHSVTIEQVLIGRHDPPLAEQVPGDWVKGRFRGGYRITARGRELYRETYYQHVAAHPDVRAPHPRGTETEPWPAEADEILARHRRYYHLLCRQWEAARAACDAAGHEATGALPEVPEALPAAVHEMAAARHQLWAGTARERAEMAAAHAGDLEALAERAARGYAAAALAAFHAAVKGSSPLDVLQPPGGSDDGRDQERLAPPATTGISALDMQARKLHAEAVGASLPRRDPPPAAGRSWEHAAGEAGRAEPPGAKAAALASFLLGEVRDGVLLRRLHPISAVGSRLRTAVPGRRGTGGATFRQILRRLARESLAPRPGLEAHAPRACCARPFAGRGRRTGQRDPSAATGSARR